MSNVAEAMAPSLVKIEDLLFGTRSRQSPSMSHYYSYWENQLYCAVVSMVLRNIDQYTTMLKMKEPVFYVRVILLSNEVTLMPDAPTLIEGLMAVVKGILEGTKKFTRRYW